MTEIKMIVEDSNGVLMEQLLRNERPFSDIQIQYEIDSYINEYISVFNKENSKNKTWLKSIKMYYNDIEIRNVQKD